MSEGAKELCMYHTLHHTIRTYDNALSANQITKNIDRLTGVYLVTVGDIILDGGGGSISRKAIQW